MEAEGLRRDASLRTDVSALLTELAVMGWTAIPEPMER